MGFFFRCSFSLEQWSMRRMARIGLWPSSRRSGIIWQVLIIGGIKIFNSRTRITSTARISRPRTWPQRGTEHSWIGIFFQVPAGGCLYIGNCKKVCKKVLIAFDLRARYTILEFYSVFHQFFDKRILKTVFFFALNLLYSAISPVSG